MRSLTEEVGDSRAAIEAIAPTHPEDAPPRALAFNWVTPQGQPVEKVYIQGQLGLFAVEEFSTRISEIVDSFMKGDMGLQIGELFQGRVEMPVELDAEKAQNFMDENAQLIQAFFNAIKLIPDLRLDITCWSLGVPRREIPWAKECMMESPARGGLSVDEGMDILIVFVKQNVPLLRRTLVGKAQELVEAFQKVIEDTDETPPSSASTGQSSTTAEPPTTAEFDSPGGTPSSTSSAPTPASA